MSIVDRVEVIHVCSWKSGARSRTIPKLRIKQPASQSRSLSKGVETAGSPNAELTSIGRPFSQKPPAALYSPATFEFREPRR